MKRWPTSRPPGARTHGARASRPCSPTAALLPLPDGLRAQVVDAAGAAVPLLADAVPWAALALTGGRPTMLVGELERTGFRVLSVRADDGLVAV